jgi:RimJ/RimL family protein N-acetyltransferase
VIGCEAITRARMYNTLPGLNVRSVLMDTVVINDTVMKPRNVTLRDGTVVHIRPLQPEDKPLLKKGFSRLSDRARYQRFGMVVRELSDEQLQYLTDIDNYDHLAWAAVQLVDEAERFIGVARYVRDDSDPSIAEVALTVADSHRGVGVGTMLLRALAQSARINGVQRFFALVVPENLSALNLARAFGATVRWLGSGTVRVTGSVPETTKDVPGSCW